MADRTQPTPSSLETDVLVIGSGAAGLTAALTARLNGLAVTIAEKEPVFGGTSAWSGGVAWIPLNRHAQAAGVADSRELARTYIQAAAGQHFDAARVDAFLDHGAAAVDFLESRTQARFELAAEPDYQQSLPGALPRGRALRPIEYDARGLGAHAPALRPPARERVLFGGLQIGAEHLAHFLKATRSFRSAWFVARRILGHLRDLAAHGRGMRPAMGNALVARLATSAFEAGIPILLSTPARELIMDGSRVVGAVLNGPQGTIRVTARRGVVLACGGFPQDFVRRQQVYPHKPSPDEHLSNAIPAATGDGIKLAESIGGAFEGGLPNPAIWYPTSRVAYPDGSVGHLAHLLERGKPGVIAVTPDGRRFANEALNYHSFVQALLATRREGQAPVAYYVCDHRALRRYGLGAARPWPLPFRRYIRTGYLKRGRTLSELAVATGIDTAQLERTVAAYNAGAATGSDPEFHKGENAYDRSQGDPRRQPNPCVGPLDRAPFYAVEIRPGDLGTFAGLRTDATARVLDQSGTPIRGLFAVGNDQASVFGGAYPGGGATIGPGLTFAYIAGRTLAGAN
ncbi:MAG: FAD-dependent oxidoreductase [Alphaproteobacteria bacterium]|nr:FAD-dependent oxidoreductase [Alphaproteobacteria bacterium]